MLSQGVFGSAEAIIRGLLSLQLPSELHLLFIVAELLDRSEGLRQLLKHHISNQVGTTLPHLLGLSLDLFKLLESLALLVSIIVNMYTEHALNCL